MNAEGTLLEALQAAGCEAEEYRSADVHVVDTPRAREIIKARGWKVDGWSAIVFKSQTDGRNWIEVAFAAGLDRSPFSEGSF